MIASMFKGLGDIDNLVAMHNDINRSGVCYDMEQKRKQALSEVPPKKVSVSFEPVHGSSSVSPVQFEEYYQIEGKLPEIRTILDQAGGSNVYRYTNSKYS